MNSASPPGPAEGRPSWLPFLLVLAAALVAQAGGLGGDWVLGDEAVVRDNRMVARGPAAVPEFFRGATWPGEMEAGAYRPLTLATFALEAPFRRNAAGALDPRGFRQTNLFLHALAAVLLLSVLRRAAPGRPILTLGAALAFAAHPLVTGAVSAAVGRADLLALAFSLLAVRAWMAYGAGTTAGLPLAGLCWFLALLSKESALGLPLVLVLLDAGAPGLWIRGALRRRLLGYSVLAPVLALFLLLWPGPASPPPGVPDSGLGSRVLVVLEGTSRLAMQAVVPVGLVGDRSDEAASRDGLDLGTPPGWAVVAAILLTLGCAVAGLRGRGGAVSLGWLLLVAMAVPAAAVLPPGAPLEERFAYLVAPGLFLWAGRAAEALLAHDARTSVWRAAAGSAAAAAALVALAGLSHVHARDWRDQGAFHEALLERDPLHVRALIRLGAWLRATAEEERDRSALLRSTDSAYGPLIESQRRHLADAIERLQAAVEQPGGRGDVDAVIELADAYRAQANPAEAERYYREAELLEPALRGEATSGRSAARAARIRSGLARTLESLGQPEAAAEAYASATTWAPHDAHLHWLAGLAKCRVGRYDEGIPLLSDALEASEDRDERRVIQDDLEKARHDAATAADQQWRYAVAAEERGDLREAVRLYERVLLADPRWIPAYLNAARLRGQHLGNYDMAYEHLARAEQKAREMGGGAEKGRLEDIARWRGMVDGWKAAAEREEAEEEAKHAEQDEPKKPGK